MAAVAFLILCSPIIGIFIFDEILEMPIVIGSVIIVSAGLYTFWRDKQERIDHL